MYPEAPVTGSVCKSHCWLYSTYGVVVIELTRQDIVSTVKSSDVLMRHFLKATPFKIKCSEAVLDFVKHVKFSIFKLMLTLKCRISYLHCSTPSHVNQTVINEPVSAAAVDTSVWPLSKMLLASIWV